MHVTLHAVPIIVSRPELLAPALAQREKSVVIENDEMERRFATLVRWQQIAPWLLIPILIAWLLNQAIVRDYKLDASWRLNWKVETLSGKITLTPTNPHPPPPKPPELPD
jgi:hypothetical protein